MIDQSAYIDLGYQQITSLTAAASLTVPAKCRLITCIPEGQGVRWRSDGTDPTATVGYPLAIGVEQSYNAEQSTRLKFIEQAASAKLNVYYWG